MNVILTPEAFEDLEYWAKQDKKTLKRIFKLIRECTRDSFNGIGKPEPLKHALAGYWSRRIDDTNRMVYAVEDDNLQIIQLRYHY